jgi:hypothetical protein
MLKNTNIYYNNEHTLLIGIRIVMNVHISIISRLSSLYLEDWCYEHKLFILISVIFVYLFWLVSFIVSSIINVSLYYISTTDADGCLSKGWYKLQPQKITFFFIFTNIQSRYAYSLLGGQLNVHFFVCYSYQARGSHNIDDQNCLFNLIMYVFNTIFEIIIVND